MDFKQLSDHLYMTIAELTGIVDDTSLATSNSSFFLSFCRPGIPLTDKFLKENEHIGAGVASEFRKNIFKLTNQVSNINNTFNDNILDNISLPTDIKIDELISTLAERSKVIHYEMTTEEKKQDENLRNEIVNLESNPDFLRNSKELSTTRIEASNLDSQYWSIMDKYSTGNSVTLDEDKFLNAYPAMKEEVITRLTSIRNIVEDSINEINTLKGKRLSLNKMSYLRNKTEIKDKASLKFDSDGTIKYNQFLPSNFASDSAKNSWVDLSIISETYNKTYERTSRTIGGSSSWFGGLFGISGGGGGSTTTDFTKVIVNNYSIKGKFTKVTIDRPWLNSNFLNEAWWTFDPAFFKTIKYKGQFEEILKNKGLQNDAVIPFSGREGFIMAYPIEAIFVSNLEISLTYNENGVEKSDINGNFSAGFSWGPFRIGGSYADSKTTEFTYDNKTTGVLKVPGTQLIGFVNKYIPLLPYPVIEEHKDHYI